jgi:hypothetical protein
MSTSPKLKPSLEKFKGAFCWYASRFRNYLYILRRTRFELDVDGYHWKAVYAKADLLEKIIREGAPTVSLCLCICPLRSKAMSLFTSDKGYILQKPR